jgi:hypothetical protein
MAKDDNAAAVIGIGCLPACWQLFVTTPLWLVILFGIITTIDAPTWLQVCFWVYVPCQILGILVNTIATTLIKAATA